MHSSTCSILCSLSSIHWSLRITTISLNRSTSWQLSAQLNQLNIQLTQNYSTDHPAESRHDTRLCRPPNRPGRFSCPTYLLTGFNYIVGIILLHALQTLMLTDLTSPLWHDLTTDAPVPGSPGTIAQITSMQGADINNMLMALNLPVTGTVPERRQHLRVHIGLLDEDAWYGPATRSN